ncbi:unnamed protein product, partial [Musa hybrid cultivar]
SASLRVPPRSGYLLRTITAEPARHCQLFRLHSRRRNRQGFHLRFYPRQRFLKHGGEQTVFERCKAWRKR